MASESLTTLTFLPWIAGGSGKSYDRKKQTNARHQHTALAAHRKKRLQKRLGALDGAAESSSSSIKPDYSDTPEHLKIELPSASLELAPSLSSTSNLSQRPCFGTPAIASPVSLLDSNRFGPFNIFPVNDVSMQELEILDHAIIHQWPAFALGINPQAVGRIREVAMQTSMASPFAFFTIIYAGQCYRSFFGSVSRQSELVRLRAKDEALRRLREALDRNGGVATDEILLTICLLTIHGAMRRNKYRHSTLPLYRDFEFYSSFKMERIHLNALRRLVRQRGGLQCITLHGLSDMIAMVDIYQSLLVLERPSFEPLRSSNIVMSAFQSSWDDLARTRFSVRQDSFDFLRSSANASRLHELITHTRILLETYNVFLRNPRSSPDFMLLIFSRRGLQYDALQLEPAEDCLVELARLTVLVFISECNQPMSIVDSFHDTISHLILVALTKCTLLGHWNAHPDFLLWATVIGGLCARESPRVLPLAQQLRQSSLPLRHDSWVFIKKLSLGFLPLEFALGDACHDFWDSACDLVSSTQPRMSQIAQDQ